MSRTAKNKDFISIRQIESTVDDNNVLSRFQKDKARNLVSYLYVEDVPTCIISDVVQYIIEIVER